MLSHAVKLFYEYDIGKRTVSWTASEAEKGAREGVVAGTLTSNVLQSPQPVLATAVVDFNANTGGFQDSTNFTRNPSLWELVPSFTIRVRTRRRSHRILSFSAQGRSSHLSIGSLKDSKFCR